MATRTITVTGRGNVSVRPDITRVTLEISALRPEYIDSYNLAQEYNSLIKGILVRLGLDDKSPKTKSLDISKKTKSVYVNGSYDHEEFLGYILSKVINIDLGMDTLVLGRLLETLGNELTDTEISISYAVSDPKQAQYEMLEDATRDSREKAIRIARTVGCELGEILSINYSWKRVDFSREVNICGGKYGSSDGSLDIEPEDFNASDDVTIVWEIK